MKLRNQANCVIGWHLGESDDSAKNGEFALLDRLSPHIGLFIDVGANVGEWSGYLLQKSQTTGYLFEPSSQCAKRLKERFGSCGGVHIREFAVSDHVGEGLFAEEAECGETSALAEARTGGEARVRQVAITTLDREFPDPTFRVDYLKIDTEGFDMKVMAGAERLLACTRFVQFEYNTSWVHVGSSLFEATRFLNRLGFIVFLIRSTGLHPLEYGFWGDYFRYSNFFACREADLPLLGDLLKPRI